VEPVAGVIKVAGTEWLLVGAACTMGKQVLYLEGNCVDGTEGFGSGAAMPNFFTFGTVFLGVKGEGHEVRLLEKGGVQLDWLVK